MLGSMVSRRSRSAARAGLVVAALAPLIAAGGCAHATHFEDSGQKIRTFSTTALVHGAPLEVHLISPSPSRQPTAPVLYASGDGGRFGAAVQMFHEIGALGYPAAGFSSKAFLKIDRPEKFLVDTHELAAEYDAVIAQTRTSLGLRPNVPVVLTGWSRGAAFAVLAASDLRHLDHVAGVIAIGLAEGEDLRIDGPDDETDDGQPAATVRRWPFQPYAQIGQLGDLPCAVIQSSGDNYFPAEKARVLFGSDTPVRRFFTVVARNHRFSGGKEQFNRSLREALSWIAQAAAD